MKNVFKFCAAFAILATLLSGCKKEKDISYAPTKENQQWKEVNLEQNFTVLKTPFRRTYRTVYLDDGYGVAQPCSTVTVTDIPTGKKQEWLYIDAYTDMFFDYYLHTNETNGGKDYGLYYQWATNFSQTTSWDYVVYSDADLLTPIFGFKIPQYADLVKLGSIIGSTSLIPNVLKLNYDGLWSNYSNYHFSTDIAAIWVDCPGDPNKVSGCGVACMWKKSTNNAMTFGYTNMVNLGTNVRIVRDIP